ncbi:MAG TPA: hypothetical protein VFM19_02535 [Candidatus Limnocylindria bacterium]|nr:hypothetical protein [Candidatus Limnocylindria bacterium]
MTQSFDLATVPSDDVLTGVRAAISMIADHAARRVTLHLPDGAAMLPAAYLLARARGVTVRPVGSGTSAWDLVFTAGDAGG